VSVNELNVWGEAGGVWRGDLVPTRKTRLVFALFFNSTFCSGNELAGPRRQPVAAAATNTAAWLLVLLKQSVAHAQQCVGRSLAGRGGQGG